MHELAIQIKDTPRSTLFPLSTYQELDMMVVRQTEVRAVMKPG